MKLAIKKMEALLNFLNLKAPGDVFEYIEEITFLTVPDEIKLLFFMGNDCLVGCEFIFLGHSPLTCKEILNSYKFGGERAGFFDAYSAKEDFSISDEENIVLYDGFREGSEDVEISNLITLMPLFSFQGDYIVVNLSEENKGQLIAISNGYDATVLAPSLVEHVSDLIDGLLANRYEIEGGEVVYPTSWQKRVKMKSGQYKMDEYGDLVEVT